MKSPLAAGKGHPKMRDGTGRHPQDTGLRRGPAFTTQASVHTLLGTWGHACWANPPQAPWHEEGVAGGCQSPCDPRPAGQASNSSPALPASIRQPGMAPVIHPHILILCFQPRVLWKEIPTGPGHSAGSAPTSSKQWSWTPRHTLALPGRGPRGPTEHGCTLRGWHSVLALTGRVSGAASFRGGLCPPSMATLRQRGVREAGGAWGCLHSHTGPGPSPTPRLHCGQSKAYQAPHNTDTPVTHTAHTGYIRTSAHTLDRLSPSKSPDNFQRETTLNFQSFLSICLAKHLYIPTLQSTHNVH